MLPDTPTQQTRSTCSWLSALGVLVEARLMGLVALPLDPTPLLPDIPPAALHKNLGAPHLSTATRRETWSASCPSLLRCSQVGAQRRQAPAA